MRIRRAVSSLLLLLSATVGMFAVPTVASAEHITQYSGGTSPDFASYVHHDWFWWQGVSYPIRGMWIIDRTGDANVQANLTNFVNFWNTMAQDRSLFYNPNVSYLGWYSNLPVVNWYADTSHPGYGSTSGAGCANESSISSYIVVCKDFTMGNAGQGGPLQMQCCGHILKGVAKLGSTAFSSGAYLTTVIGHEIGHAMGLHHAWSWEPNSIMQSAVSAGAWYDATDKYSLQLLYNHPLGT